MNEEKKLQQMYDRLLGYEQELHIKNQRRIRVGLKCLYIIPAIFLIMLFVTDSSKEIFLVLWIVSLFLLCAYLIFVEYSDYMLQEKLHELQGTEHGEVESLIDLTLVEERVASAVGRIEARGGKEE